MVGEQSTREALAEQIRQRLSDIVDNALSLDKGLTATADSLIEVDDSVFDAGLFTAAERAEQPPMDTLRYHAPTDSVQRWSGHSWKNNAPPRKAAYARPVR